MRKVNSFCSLFGFEVSFMIFLSEPWQARELGRYGAATQLAKRGGST